MNEIDRGVPLEPSPEELERLMRTCEAFVARHLAGLAAMPASDTEGADAGAEGFRDPSPEHGYALEALLARLEPAFSKSYNTAGPGYLAFIPGGGIPSAGLADLIACMTNRFIGVTAAAPALARIEATAIG